MDLGHREELEALIANYQISHVQSEAEVRSKLIVPLIEWLGYPPQNRAEEFPVYGNEGRKIIPAKNADFLLFSAPDFAEHRNRNELDIQWVQNHSLLIVEAKKPTESVDDLGQPTYYSIWTKAVAYLQTNGKVIRGYYRESLVSDSQVIDCNVADLASFVAIADFSYNKILSIKQKANDDAVENRRKLGRGTLITKDEDLQLPDHVINYMRTMLGRNSEGLSNVQVTSRYLNSIDFYLQNKLRYDIPPYMFSVPRKQHKAALYINDTVFPFLQGHVTFFCWNEFERYHFENEIFILEIMMVNGCIQGFAAGFTIQDVSVSARLSHFNQLRKCFSSDSFRIQVFDEEKTSLLLHDVQGPKWLNRENVLESLARYEDDLSKLSEIETYYGITFRLRYLDDPEQIREQCKAINLVYDGIKGNNNASISVLEENIVDKDLCLEEAVVFAEKDAIKLPKKTIQGVVFAPSKGYFKPGRLQITKGLQPGVSEIDFCCEYEVVTA